IALFLGAVAAGDPGYLANSEPGGNPTGELDLSRPLAAGEPASAVLAGALWAWADASGDLTGASRAALAASRALGAGAEDPAAVLSLVAAQLDGAERDQACAVFRARLHAVRGHAAAGVRLRRPRYSFPPGEEQRKGVEETVYEELKGPAPTI